LGFPIGSTPTSSSSSLHLRNLVLVVVCKLKPSGVLCAGVQETLSRPNIFHNKESIKWGEMKKMTSSASRDLLLYTLREKKSVSLSQDYFVLRAGCEDGLNSGKNDSTLLKWWISSKSGSGVPCLAFNGILRLVKFWTLGGQRSRSKFCGRRRRVTRRTGFHTPARIRFSSHLVSLLYWGIAFIGDVKALISDLFKENLKLMRELNLIHFLSGTHRCAWRSIETYRLDLNPNSSISNSTGLWRGWPKEGKESGRCLVILGLGGLPWYKFEEPREELGTSGGITAGLSWSRWGGSSTGTGRGKRSPSLDIIN